MDTDTDINSVISDYIALTESKRKLAEQQRDIQKKLDDIEPLILADFQGHGRQSENRNGYCLYLSRDISVKSATGETSDIVDKLRRARLGELIGLNWPKVKAWVKEKMHDEATDSWEVDLNKLPPSLREVVTVEEFYKLLCRKAN